MHIGVVCDPASFHTQKWAKGLKAAGAKVTVFSFSEAKIEGITCIQLKPTFTYKGNITYLSFLMGGKNLAEAARAQKIDILNPINMTPYGVWAERSGFRPLVGIAMGSDILEYPPATSALLQQRSWNNIEGGKRSFFSQLKEKIARPIFRHYVQKALNACDLITGDNLVLTDAVKDWFQIPAEKVKLNRWGVEEELFACSESDLAHIRQKLRIQPDKKLVLSPRGVKAIYQGDIILESFAQLLQKGQEDTHFLMLAAGYEVPEKLLRRARELENLYPNFSFWDTVLPREELYQLWNLVDVFVSAPIYDGYSNALGEGRYIGAIPVVNDIPATREILLHKENAWIVSPFEAESLAVGIAEILQDVAYWKARFAMENKPWMLENSMLKSNMKQFLADCEGVLA